MICGSVMYRITLTQISRTWRDFPTGLGRSYRFVTPEPGMHRVPGEGKYKKVVVGKRMLGLDRISVPARLEVEVARCCEPFDRS